MIPGQHQRFPTRGQCRRRPVYARIQICHTFHTQTNRLEVSADHHWSLGGSFEGQLFDQFILSSSDSPKLRNKTQNPVKYNRNANSATKKPILSKTKAKSVAHDIVVVREANKKFGPDRDPDLQKLQVRRKRHNFHCARCCCHTSRAVNTAAIAHSNKI